MRSVLSVITPVYNEEANLSLYMERIRGVARELAADGVSLEVVLVDDHSSDRTPAMARSFLHDAPLPMKYIRLSRNSGSHTACAAGLRHCSGDAAVLIAADLQDPPELIRQLLAEYQSGSDVVWAARSSREGESWGRQLTSNFYYLVMRALAIPGMPAKGADFLLISRKVIDAYNSIPEKHTSLFGMILWMGFRQSGIEYVKQRRHAGSSKWTFAKKVTLFIDSVISFSYVPIRLMSAFGFFMAAVGLLYAIYVLLGRVFFETVAPGTGFAALMTVLLVGQGTLMMMLGILGEYVWRTYDEARGRPRFLIEDFHLSDSFTRNDPAHQNLAALPSPGAHDAAAHSAQTTVAG